MADRVGQKLGNYRLVRLLGEGSFAKVYLGEHVHLGTQAAIKVLQTTLLPEDAVDFRTEARTIARLIHPHIVRVFDYGVKRNNPFLVMDYAPHDTLRKLHPEGSRLPPEIVLPYVRQIAAALEYAHQHNVIHRDVKPENMLLGRNHEVLLSDFGLAVVASSSQHHALQEVVGTITYTAPEQLEGNPCPASDQYALGVVIYEWLCSTPPFQGTHREVAYQHLEADPPPLCEKAPALTPLVEQVVLMALAKDPKRRFASIEAFAAALEQVIVPGRTNQEGSSAPAQISLVGISSHMGRSHQHPLLGRDREREVLRHLLFETEQCRNALVADHTTPPFLENRPSRSPFIVLCGEAGIGKTRLAEEVGREAQQRGWTVLWSQSYARESPTPYRLWIEAVRQAMTQGLLPYQEMKQHPRLYRLLGVLLPELAEMLPQDAASSAFVLEQEQLRLWEALLALLGAISRRTALLLVFDDLHWSDESSRELLAYLARRLHSYPILLLGTYRESEMLTSHPFRLLLTTLQREQVITTLAVPRLANTYMSIFLAHLPEPLMQRIQHQAAGNPFFAEELARVASAKEKSVQVLPATITAVLDLRLGMFSPACQQLLGKAAVLGNSFSFQEISLLEANNSSNLEEERVLTLLEEALHGSILSEEGSGVHVTYTFRHPLMVSRLYEGISAARRTNLHRRAADVLQQVYRSREDELAAAITHHLVEGGAEPQQIVHYASLAADRAYILSAYPEAEKYYRIAVEHIGKGVEAPLADAQEQNEGIPNTHLAYLLERLGECTRVQGNYKEARHLYERVLEVRSHQRTFASPEEYQQEAQIDALLWCEIALTWYDIGDNLQAKQCCERGEQVLHEAGVEGGSAWAVLRFQQGYIGWHEGKYEEARLSALEALKLFDEALQQQDCIESNASRLTGTRRTLAGNPVNLGRTHTLLAAIIVTTGQSTDALAHLNTAVAVFEQYGRQREIANVSCNIGDVHLKRAEHELAKKSFHRSRQLAERVGDTPLMSVVFYNLGELAIRTGDLAEAETMFKQSITIAEQINDQTYMSLFNVGLTTVFKDQGKLAEAGVCVQRALSLGRTMNSIPCIGIALVALGNLRIAQAIETGEVQNIEQKKNNISQEAKQKNKNSSTHFLLRAKRTLEHALTLEESEAETRIEGQMALAYVSLLLGDIETAWRYAARTLEEAHQYELIWGSSRCQRLLGSITAAHGLKEEAAQYFEQAIQTFRNHGMRLEYARTLHSYGVSLLERKSGETSDLEQGLSYLHEARQIFSACHAVLDFQLVEGIFAGHTPA